MTLGQLKFHHNTSQNVLLQFSDAESHLVLKRLKRSFVNFWWPQTIFCKKYSSCQDGGCKYCKELFAGMKNGWRCAFFAELKLIFIAQFVLGGYVFYWDELKKYRSKHAIIHLPTLPNINYREVFDGEGPSPSRYFLVGETFVNQWKNINYLPLNYWLKCPYILLIIKDTKKYYFVRLLLWNYKA